MLLPIVSGPFEESEAGSESASCALQSTFSRKEVRRDAYQKIILLDRNRDPPGDV